MSEKLQKVIDALGDIEIPLTIKLESAKIFEHKPELQLKDAKGISVKYTLQIDPTAEPFGLGFNVAESAATSEAIANTLRMLVIKQLAGGFQHEFQAEPEQEVTE